MVQLRKAKSSDDERKAKESPGSRFLREAKAKIDAVFEEFLVNQEEYDTLEDIFDRVQSEVWEEAEKSLKANFYNGKRLGLAEARREQS